MKSAKEMFEDLGYEIILNIDEVLIYEESETSGYQIIFCKRTKTVDIDKYSLPMEEIKAINKQLEELGWLDEKEN